MIYFLLGFVFSVAGILIGFRAIKENDRCFIRTIKVSLGWGLGFLLALGITVITT